MTRNAGSATRLNRSSNRRPGSAAAQRCSFVCIPSTRCPAVNGTRAVHRCSPVNLLALPYPPCSIRCRPSPCGRLSRPRSTTAAPPHHEPIGGQWTQPATPVGRASRKIRGGSRVHVIPIDEGGTQLYPGSPRGYATDLLHELSGRFRTGATPRPIGSRAPQYRPRSARFESAPHNEASDTGSSRIPSRLAHRARTIWQYWHDSTLSGPLATSTHPFPWVRLPPASPNRCDNSASEVFHLRSDNHAPHGARCAADGSRRLPLSTWPARGGAVPQSRVSLSLPRSRSESTHQCVHHVSMTAPQSWTSSSGASAGARRSQPISIQPRRWGRSSIGWPIPSLHTLRSESW